MVLASILGNTMSFLIILILVLALDSIWGVLAWAGFAGTRSQKAEIKWAAINFIAVVVLIVLYIFVPFLLQSGLTDRDVQSLIILVAVVRTVADYACNLRFYCP